MNRRQAKIPMERIVCVEPDIRGYVGLATAVVIGGEDVIVIGRSVEQLRKVVHSNHPGAPFEPAICYEVVVVHRRNADVDDEL